MRLNVNLTTKIFDKINSMKKISRISSFDANDLQLWFNTIMEINSLQEDEANYQGVSLEQWKIHKGFQQLILPQKISVTAARQDVDLVSVENERTPYTVRNVVTDDETGEEFVEWEDAPVLDKDKFEAMSNMICSTRRADAELVTVLSCRAEVTVSTIIGRYSSNGNVQYKAEAFVPIEFSTVLVKPYYLNEDAEQIFLDWFRDVLVSI